MTDADLIAYYQALLIMQYVNKPRASGTVGAFVTEAVASQIVQTVEDGFNLDTAVGAQLDGIASYLGLSRNVVGFDPSRLYFSTLAYGETSNSDLGFAPVYGVDPVGYFLRYENIAAHVYTLTDDELRRLCQLTAQLHASTLGLGEIDSIIFDFFGDSVTLIDNRDMTITYQGSVSDPDLLFAIVTEIKGLPAPAGVAVSYTTV